MSTRRRCISGVRPILSILGVGCAVALMTLPVQAHRLDELLQATLISVGPAMVDLEINLTPGVEAAGPLIAGIDTNKDGILAEEEVRTFVESVLSKVRLTLDGRLLVVEPRSQEIASLADLRAGVGALRVTARAALGRVANGEHWIVYLTPQLVPSSVYLVNALMPTTPRVKIQRQERDQLQTTFQLTYTLSTPRLPAGTVKQ